MNEKTMGAIPVSALERLEQSAVKLSLITFCLRHEELKAAPDAAEIHSIKSDLSRALREVSTNAAACALTGGIPEKAKASTPAGAEPKRVQRKEIHKGTAYGVLRLRCPKCGGFLREPSASVTCRCGGEVQLDNLTRYTRIVCTAPTMQQLDNVLWAEMAKWLDASPVLQMMFTWTKTRVYMNGYDRRWFAVPRTATKPESLQGFHEDNMLFVVDEASGVADPILDAIGGTLTGANNRLLYCGNPTKATGGFAESFQGDGMDWYCMTVSSRDSPRTSKENIAALEKKYGKNSNVVRVRVDGLPPVADSDVFIPSYIAEKATMNEPLPHDSPVRLSIGCDVARFGDDCTVIAPNIDADVQELKIRNGQDLWATAEDIIFEYLFLLEKYPQYPGMVYAIIDDTGLGGGVTDILRHEREARGLNQLEVIPVNFGASVPQEDAAANYADISTWMWSLVRDMAQSGRLHLPNDTELIAQLSTRKYAFAGTPPKLKLESKDIMKRRGLPSPDRADAVALSLYQPVTYTWEIG